MIACLEPTCVLLPVPVSNSGQARRSRLGRAVVCVLSASILLGGCDSRDAAAVKPVVLVRTEVARLQEHRTSVTLTGDVQARVRADMSFRVSGRVTERLVDIGAHVEAGEVLARIDPAEQQADLDAATAAVAAAEAQVRVATASFDRQQMLMTSGFTTRPSFDQAQEGLRVAQGALETAQAQLGTAKDTLSYTELRASAPGVITARSIEVGQVADAAQTAFTLAVDGDRDAVFDVYESILFRQPARDTLTLSLLSDPGIKAEGRVREVAPTVDPKNATVRVKVAILNPPAAMTLGSAVVGTGEWKPTQRIILPWSALAANEGGPAVWVIDRAKRTVSLRAVAIDAFETGTIVISSGLQEGDLVVTDGGKFLSPGRAVTFDEASGT